MSPLTITTIQTGLQWEDKRTNLKRFEERILAIPEPTEVVVLPEMFSTGFSVRPATLAERMDGPTVAWMQEIAARKKVILTGSIIVEEEGNYYNRMIWMLPNGQYGYYDKRHRFAYAGEDEQYTAGNKRLIASVKGWKVLLLVCYDLRFPVWSRQAPRKGQKPDERDPTPSAAAPPADAPDRRMPVSPVMATHPPAGHPDAPDLEYDLLLYVANWPESRAHAWKTLLQARAIENQCFVAGVNRIGKDGNDINYSGDTMILDPLAETIYHAAAKDEVHTVTLRKEDLLRVRTRFPFWQDADRFSIEP
jgi:omega-amidase